MNKVLLCYEAKDTEVKPLENRYIKNIKGFFEEVTLLTRFTFRFFKTAVKPTFEFAELIKQAYLIGYKSFPLVAITGFIMGLVNHTIAPNAC